MYRLMTLQSWSRFLMVGVVALVGLSACSDDETDSSTSTTMPITTTTSVTTTTSMGSNVESLSYLIQGLINTDEIAGGWIDQGRQVIPPNSDQLSGFLCEEGEAAVAALEGRLDPQVSTSFRRPDDLGLSVFETLMWGDREQLVEDFDVFVNAVKSCDGKTYTTSELGQLTLTVDETPVLGTAGIAFHFGPPDSTVPTPWLEQWSTSVLLSDPNESVALVVGVGASVIHDPPDSASTELDIDEYGRIVKAAVDRILEGL